MKKRFEKMTNALRAGRLLLACAAVWACLAMGGLAAHGEGLPCVVLDARISQRDIVLATVQGAESGEYTLYCAAFNAAGRMLAIRATEAGPSCRMEFSGVQNAEFYQLFCLSTATGKPAAETVLARRVSLPGEPPIVISEAGANSDLAKLFEGNSYDYSLSFESIDREGNTVIRKYIFDTEEYTCNLFDREGNALITDVPEYFGVEVLDLPDSKKEQGKLPFYMVRTGEGAYSLYDAGRRKTVSTAACREYGWRWADGYDPLIYGYRGGYIAFVYRPDTGAGFSVSEDLKCRDISRYGEYMVFKGNSQQRIFTMAGEDITPPGTYQDIGPFTKSIRISTSGQGAHFMSENICDGLFRTRDSEDVWKCGVWSAETQSWIVEPTTDFKDRWGDLLLMETGILGLDGSLLYEMKQYSASYFGGEVADPQMNEAQYMRFQDNDGVYWVLDRQGQKVFSRGGKDVFAAGGKPYLLIEEDGGSGTKQGLLGPDGTPALPCSFDKIEFNSSASWFFTAQEDVSPNIYEVYAPAENGLTLVFRGDSSRAALRTNGNWFQFRENYVFFINGGQILTPDLQTVLVDGYVEEMGEYDGELWYIKQLSEIPCVREVYRYVPDGEDVAQGLEDLEIYQMGEKAPVLKGAGDVAYTLSGEVLQEDVYTVYKETSNYFVLWGPEGANAYTMYYYYDGAYTQLFTGEQEMSVGSWSDDPRYTDVRLNDGPTGALRGLYRDDGTVVVPLTEDAWINPIKLNGRQFAEASVYGADPQHTLYRLDEPGVVALETYQHWNDWDGLPDGCLAIVRGGKQGIYAMTDSGPFTELLPCEYESTIGWSENYYIFRKDGQKFYFDLSLSPFLPERGFKDCTTTSHADYIILHYDENHTKSAMFHRINGSWQEIDSGDVHRCEEGLWYVRDQSTDKCRVYRFGNDTPILSDVEIVWARYSGVLPLAYRDENWRVHYIGSDGQPINGEAYYPGSGFQGGFARVGKPDTSTYRTIYGFINAAGELAVDMQYRNVSDFYSDLAWVQTQDGLWQLIQAPAGW